MIAGFNTDIDYQGTVYHVQTEDKGVPARIIMSLVYNRGTILASKRASYEDLGSADNFEKEVGERLGRQHKLICAAVKAGRIDELVKMTRAAGGRSRPGTVFKAPVPLVSADDVPAFTAAQGLPGTQSPRSEQTGVPRPPIKIGMIELEELIHVIPDEMFEDEVVIDAVRIIEAEEIELLPAEAVAVVSELSGQERKANQKLSLELLGDTKFKGGDRRTLSIMICRGTERKVVAEAQVMIKVLGSSFRPLIFHAKTDVNGLARVHLQLPHFQTGRAALLVRAITSGEEIEIRRVVTPG